MDWIVVIFDEFVGILWFFGERVGDVINCFLFVVKYFVCVINCGWWGGGKFDCGGIVGSVDWLWDGFDCGFFWCFWYLIDGWVGYVDFIVYVFIYRLVYGGGFEIFFGEFVCSYVVLFWIFFDFLMRVV